MRFVLITVDTIVLVNYKRKIIINIYVYNNIYISKKLQLFNKFGAQFKEKFEVKLLKEVKLILNMLIKIDIKCKTFYLNYMYNVWNLLYKYNIIEANFISTLIIQGSIILFSKNKDIEFDIIINNVWKSWYIYYK